MLSRLACAIFCFDLRLWSHGKAASLSTQFSTFLLVSRRIVGNPAGMPRTLTVLDVLQNGVGPPYGLLQGVMSQLERVPPKEESSQIQCAPRACLRSTDAVSVSLVCTPTQHMAEACRRGHVATIHPEKDFYIALSDHRDWSDAHTAWGFIDDLSVADELVRMPFTESTHKESGTVMRMLHDPVPFTVELI